ncbi:MAG: GNAT family N-acetyltransferase [Candidatus Sumerlaeota bacterium]|nr:GNAT family N-acetyltransferase [Candidatus Sumerlaeota bacterium]
MTAAPLTFRFATQDDILLLAEMNHQLICDEGHRNRMTVPELAERMHNWLAGEYRAVIFEEDGEIAAYVLFREQPEEIYLRQLFVVRHRRRQGIGRRAMEILRSQIWPQTKRLTVEVLTANAAAVAFWRAVGYSEYSLTLEIRPAREQPVSGMR